MAIVQARMGSSRFPGKMMAELCGIPLMEWVLRRSAAANSFDGVVLATTNLEQDDILTTVADNIGVLTYRGSAEDVLGRFVEAAKTHAADVVVRICADRPLVAPEVIDQAVSAFLDNGSDLTFNHIADPGQNWPRGFGVEVLTADHLFWLDRNAVSQAHREHVTLYLWDHRTTCTIVPTPCPEELDPGYPGVALDVDHLADLRKLREICAGLDQTCSAASVMEAWRASRFAGTVDVLD